MRYWLAGRPQELRWRSIGVCALRRTDATDIEPVVTEVVVIAAELTIATTVVQVVTTLVTAGSSEPPVPVPGIDERPLW